jgi:hypothetical protein
MIGSVNKIYVRSLCYSVSKFLFALLIVNTGLPDLSAQTGFYRVHHIPENSTTYEIEEYKGRYYIGTSTFCDGFRECAILSEIDENGNILWSELIPEIDIAYTLTIYEDTIFIAGNRDPQQDIFLIAKYDLDGERIAFESIEHNELKFERMFLLLTAVFNNRILLSGHGRRNDSTYNLLYILNRQLELDTLVIVSRSKFGNSPAALFETQDSLLTIMLRLNDGGLPGNWRQILQYDKDFNLVWRYETEKTTGDRVIPVGCELPDGRLIMACRHEGTDYIASVCCINKDSTLSWRFDHPLHGSRGRRIYRIKPLPNGDIIGCGHYTELQFSEHRLSTTPFLFKISAEGNLLWERVYYEIDPRIINSSGRLQNRLGNFWDFVFMPDGGYMLAGFVNNDNWDVLIVRTDEHGCIYPDNCHTENIIDLTSSAEEIAVEIPGLRMYPNPTSDGLLYIEMGYYHHQHDYRLKVYDMSGRLAHTDVIMAAVTSHQLSVQAGIYIVTVEMDGHIISTEKLVKTK